MQLTNACSLCIDIYLVKIVRRCLDAATLLFGGIVDMRTSLALL